MLKKISTIYKIIFMAGFSTIYANSVVKGNECPDIKINKNLNTYLSETQKPVLLLGCGHLTESEIDSESLCITRELFGTNRYYHTHKNEYSIDLDSKKHPDVVGGASSALFSDLLAQGGKEKFQLIWEEGIPRDVLQPDMVDKLYDLLKPDGYLAFKTSSNDQFNDSVQKKFGNRREFKFDKVSFDTMDYLLTQGMITRLPNGDLDYSGIGTTEVITERQERGKGQEEWEELLNFPTTKRMVDAGQIVFENNIIYKVDTYHIKLEKLREFDDDRKRLYDIAPELVNYPMDLYIAQKIS